MRFQVKQKLISVGDDFIIKDEAGKDAFFVDGYGFSFGNKLSFQDMGKKELLLIKQTLFSFTPTYKLIRNKRPIATIRKALIAFRPTFYLDLDKSPHRIKIVGRLIEHEYRFYRGKDVIAEVSKKWFRMTDTYSVEVLSGEAVVMLATAIVIDLICHEKDSKHKR